MKQSNVAMKPQAAPQKPSKVASIQQAAAFKLMDTLHSGLSSTYGLKADMAKRIIAGTLSGTFIRQWEVAQVMAAGTDEGRKVLVRNTIRTVQNAVRAETSKGGKVGKALLLNDDKTAYVLGIKGHVRGETKAGKSGDTEGDAPKGVSKSVTPEAVCQWLNAYSKGAKPGEIAALREMLAPTLKACGIVK